MTLLEARSRLRKIADRWRRRQTILLAIRIVALALPLGVVAFVVVSGASARLGGLAVALLLASLAVWMLPHSPRADASLMARHLDRTQQSLEESTTLLLEDETSLTMLERLQQTRVASALGAIDPGDILTRQTWRAPSGELLAGLLVALTLVVVIERYDNPALGRTRSPFAPAVETAGDPLGNTEISIEPPAYTGLASHTQSALDLEAPEGSTISWRLPVQAGLDAELVSGTGELLSFELAGDQLHLQTTARESSVYRLIARVDSHEVSRTPFSRLQVTPDEPPVVAVVSPVARLTELAADTDSLDVEIRARDDHGLTAADLVATLALGSGELVEFREQRIPLGALSGGTDEMLRHRFDLRELGVGPATELYFYVEARDNRQPEPNIGRSPTTIVRIAGDSATVADLGAGLPVILPPTYFRSQRQIIIDTEKLIAESPGLDPAAIRRRSESLGGDQRALRMRYGALLGEEFVSGQAVEAGETEVEEDHDEHAPGTDEPQKVDSVFDVLPEGLFHEHDSTEIATFFTSEIRTQLKRVLAQMWESEGRLRVIDPEGALPHEYQALELLKELQQASRVYVQKVGFDAPPLEPEVRRLTGELDEIRTRHSEPTPGLPAAIEVAARSLLTWLDSPTSADLSSVAAEATTLRESVARFAAENPQGVLALLAIDDLLADRTPSEATSAMLQTALWELMPRPDPTPDRPFTTNDPLSSHYRQLRAEDGES